MMAATGQLVTMAQIFRAPMENSMTMGIGLIAAFAASSAALAADGEAMGNRSLPADSIRWVNDESGAPVRLGPLWGVRAQGAAGTYLKASGGFEAPLHSHTADYRAIVVKGTWSHWIPANGETEGEALPVGSYWTQRANQPHKDACISTEACIILLINDEPYRTVIEE